MLLIGQPKSCTTSLGRTLAHTMKIKYCNGIGCQKYDYTVEEFKTIRQYHTSKLIPTEEELKSWINNKNLLFKDHILPIKKNIDIVKKSGRVLILLRNPEHCLDNYKRMYVKYRTGGMTEKEVKELTPQLLEKVDWGLLLDDLKAYNEGWKNANLSNAKYIDFDELVLCPKRILLEIHKFLNIPVRNKITGLVRAKGNKGYNTYTGVGLERAKKEHGIK